MFDLSTRDVKYLPGVGPQRAAILNKELNIYSLRDLLYYFPYKYVDRSRLYYIHEIDGNMPYIQLRGRILSFEMFGEGRQRRLVGHFTDGTGVVDLVWFQGLKYITGKYKANEEYIVFGKPTVFNGRINVAHPDIDPAQELTLSTMGLQPYYNTTEKMKRTSLNSHALEKLMKNLFQALQKESFEETLSPSLIAAHQLMPLTDALYNIHFPQNPELLRKAQYRLKFEELFYVQLNILRYTKERRNKFRGLVFERVGEIFNTFYAHHLPFQLTGAQKRVIKEMRRDMGSGRQMNRLLQGDVGSGKTLVALMTMLIALDNGFQACMMAPTEILATQHYETIRRFLNGMPVRVELLTGNVKGKRRETILRDLLTGADRTENFPNPEVYVHEMPGGQYTNLKQQAQALGLIHRWEEIKDMYHRVSMMFGDLIKVTPSSKVVGDMALFMVQNELTEEDVYAKGDILDFPASVVEFFEGRIGTPYQGFPEKLQKLVLKGRAPISERPGAVLPPVDFEDVRAKLKELEAPTTDEAVSAYCLYPKVFIDWVNRYNQFGDVSVLDTPTFFFGMTPGEVIKVEIEQGKVLVIKLDHISEANAAGMRTVFFEFNGLPREIEIKDRNAKTTTVTRKKAEKGNMGEIGASLSGSVVKVLVEKGQSVTKGTPLIVTEAMKMETTLSAPISGIVSAIHVAAGERVESGDCLLEIKTQM